MDKTFRHFVLAVQRAFNDFDPKIKEHSYEESLKDDPPIFIVGSPRAGSTMLFQILCGQFQLSYISNIMAAFPSWMVRFVSWLPRTATGYRGDIRESRYGYVPGLLSPNESGKILARWLEPSQDPDHQIFVKRTFGAITKFSGCPMLMKNQNRLTVNMARLEEIFGNPRYIFIKRDPLYTAQSILIARRETLQDDSAWFSAKPPGYQEQLGKDPFYQVLWQVLALEHIVEKSSQNIPRERFFSLDYEDFCAAPGNYLHGLLEKFGLTWKEGAAPDDLTLNPSKRIKLPREDWEKLTQVYQEIKDANLFED